MSEASGGRTPVSFLRVGLFSVVVLGIIVGGFLWINDPDQRIHFSDAVSPVVDALAAASLFIAARYSAARSKRSGLAWGTIGLAILLYAIGDILWAILELFLKEEPFPSIADAFYLLYYPFFLTGAVLLAYNKPASPGEQFNRALDLVTVLAAAILGFWNFLIGPIIESNVAAPVLEQLILLAYPVGDLVLLGGLLVIIYNDADEQDMPALALLAGGIVLMIFGDSLYSYQSLLGTYVSGGLLDLAWIAATLLIGLAGASQWAAVQPTKRTGRSQAGNDFRAGLRIIKIYLPYFWLLGAFVLLIMRGLTPLPMSFSSIALGVGVIMILVLARQFIALSENYNLKIQLQAQASLESANRALQTEIMERKRIEEKLSYDAMHDGMTGLANRALYLDRLGQAIERIRRHREHSFAVLFVDLDQFKVVNDSLGHFSGDQLLISISKRLRQTLRSTDTIARFGGDEFAVLLDDLKDESTARMLAERIQAAIALPFMLDGREVHVTASIGVVTDVTAYDHPEDLLRDADLAMYQAKALGAGRSEMFAVELRDKVFSRLEMEEALRSGLRRQEFRLYYQPIQSLESSQIVGFEALLRWMHPARGLLSPADFLPVAEESGLILPMGEWVLNQACLQMKTWQQQRPHLQNVSVSVNLSDKEFSQPNLLDKVSHALRASGLKGSALKLEITERVLVGNSSVANRLIAILKDMGVQLQIDDFGTGYSALAYLQQFPFDAIKIDGSFVSQMNKDRKSLGLVRAIVSMAHELGMEAIAEGIETGQQLNQLKGLSCGFGQGFLLSRPMDAASVEQLLAKPKRAARR